MKKLFIILLVVFISLSSCKMFDAMETLYGAIEAVVEHEEEGK